MLAGMRPRLVAAMTAHTARPISTRTPTSIRPPNNPHPVAAAVVSVTHHHNASVLHGRRPVPEDVPVRDPRTFIVRGSRTGTSYRDQANPMQNRGVVMMGYGYNSSSYTE